MEDLRMLGIAGLVSSFCCKMCKITIFIVIFLATVLAGISWTAFFGLGFGMSDFVLFPRKTTDLQVKLKPEVQEVNWVVQVYISSKDTAQELRFKSVLFESQEFLTSLCT